MSTKTLVVSPTQWADLKDIENVEPLNEGDMACLVEIREVLKKYGRQDRLGVALLHSHFEMAPDELLMEFSDKDERVLTTKPVKTEEAENAIGTIWKLLDGDIESMAYCKKYCKRDWLKGHIKAHNVRK